MTTLDFVIAIVAIAAIVPATCLVGRIINGHRLIDLPEAKRPATLHEMCMRNAPLDLDQMARDFRKLEEEIRRAL